MTAAQTAQVPRSSSSVRRRIADSVAITNRAYGRRTAHRASNSASRSPDGRPWPGGLLDLGGLTQRRLDALPDPAYLCAMCVTGELVVWLYSQYYPARFPRARAPDAGHGQGCGPRGRCRRVPAGGRLAGGVGCGAGGRERPPGPGCAGTALCLLASLSLDLAGDDGGPRHAEWWLSRQH